MSKRVDLTALDEIFVGEDKNLQFYVTTGEPVEVAATVSAGATTITVRPLREAISNSVKIRFGNLIATLTAAADAGDTTITVTAILGDLLIGAIGRKIQDITNWNFTWVLALGPTSVAILTKTPSINSAANGVVDLALLAANLTIAGGEYYHRLKRTDAGFVSVLAYGRFILLP